MQHIQRPAIRGFQREKYRIQGRSYVMGKKKNKSEYNGFLDGEKLCDNVEVRTTLQTPKLGEVHSMNPPAQDQADAKWRKSDLKDVKKPPLTHFLCLPLVTDANRQSLRDKLSELKHKLNDTKLVSTKAVRPAGTLHLTLGVMSLSGLEIEEVTQFLHKLELSELLRNITLQQAAKEAAEASSVARNISAAMLPDKIDITINLKHLVPMQIPSKTSIVYAEPNDASQRLYPFASALRERFLAEGYIIEDVRPLRLHATILNTIYAKPGRSATPRKNCRPKDWRYLDATSLIEEYREFSWAENIVIDRVHICKMGAKKIWSSGNEGEQIIEDEEYEIIASRFLDL